MDNTISHDHILPETRWLAALVIPFLVIAFVILYIFPQNSEKLFAWKIQPSMSAMMLGAAYAGGIYFFAWVLKSKHWHKIKVGFLPIVGFTTLLGIATILHWDRFNHHHISFVAWAGLYFTTPFIVLFVWLRNRSQDIKGLDPQENLLPALARVWIGLIGVTTLVFCIFLFLEPAVMIKVWPWTLTPLTSRVMSAMFVLPGIVGLGIASDPRWSSARIILQSQSLSILLILLAAARAWDEFNWQRVESWIFVGGLVALLASIIILYLSMESKRKKPKRNYDV
jgi:hypothetical protein